MFSTTNRPRNGRLTAGLPVPGTSSNSGVVLHDVESTDANYDGQNLFGISANVADNDEPFIVLRPTDGSTIITEGGMTDEFEVVLVITSYSIHYTKLYECRSPSAAGRASPRRRGRW